MIRKPVTVADIRADKTLGRGSCSIYDETRTDAELQEELDSFNKEFKTRREVLQEMKRINRICLDRMCEQMDGWY